MFSEAKVTENYCITNNFRKEKCDLLLNEEPLMSITDKI